MPLTTHTAYQLRSHRQLSEREEAERYGGPTVALRGQTLNLLRRPKTLLSPQKPAPALSSAHAHTTFGTWSIRSYHTQSPSAVIIGQPGARRDAETALLSRCTFVKSLKLQRSHTSEVSTRVFC